MEENRNSMENNDKDIDEFENNSSQQVEVDECNQQTNLHHHHPSTQV